MTRAARYYEVGNETEEDLAAIETDIRGMRIADHHRAKLAKQFRDDQERRWAADSHHRAIKRGNSRKSKRGFQR